MLGCTTAWMHMCTGASVHGCMGNLLNLGQVVVEVDGEATEGADGPAAR